jgi:hypothetical protein
MKLATPLRGLGYKELVPQNLVCCQVVAFRHRVKFGFACFPWPFSDSVLRPIFTVRSKKVVEPI